MLEFLRYDAEVVSHGAAAVESYKRALVTGGPFDAVILDYVVPDGMGGDAAIARLAEIGTAARENLPGGGGW